MTRPAAWPPRPGSTPMRWARLPVLMLLVLLACHWAAARAAPDPTAEAVQRALVERGFDPGEIDGAMGSRTRHALEEFQRSIGLPGTGQADSATLEALGLKPAADAPEPELPSVESDLTIGAGTSDDEPSRPDAVPERAAGATLRFADLGWHLPQTGAEALERFRAIGAPPVFRRGSGSLFVPNPELVFVLAAGEEVPGLDCDPGSDRLAVEFAFGPDGPVIFTPVSGGTYCQMGIGIALEVGGTLEMRRIDWGDVQYRSGTARITSEGLALTR